MLGFLVILVSVFSLAVLLGGIFILLKINSGEKFELLPEEYRYAPTPPQSNMKFEEIIVDLEDEEEFEESDFLNKGLNFPT